MNDDLEEIKAFIEDYEKRNKKKSFKTIIKEAISEYISWVLNRKTKEQERKEIQRLTYQRLKNILRYIEEQEQEEKNNL